jgi:hypothetical protein
LGKVQGGGQNLISSFGAGRAGTNIGVLDFSFLGMLACLEFLGATIRT